MRAILHDCEGPFALRAAPLALWALPFLALAVGAGGATTYALVLLAACLPGVLPRLQPREVEVRLGGGELRLVGGARSQRLRARDVIGASTARVSHGVALTLARRDRQTPTTLVFASEAELERAREALGVGHGGLGAVSWPLVPGAAHTSAPTARAIAASLSLAALASALAGSTTLAGVVLFFATFPAFFGVVWAALRGSSQTVELGARGVTLRGYQHSQVPYAAISGVARVSGMFELGVHGGTLRARHRVGALAGAGVDDAEFEILSAQLAACVGRASGLGPQKPEATTRIDTLRRGHESARDWLARVDMAASLLAQPGYRGGTIDREDLWLTLRDPEAAEDLRAAAGRVLVRVETEPDVRARVSDIVAAVREGDAQQRLRVAIFPELDPHAEELEQLEQRAAKRALTAPGVPPR